MPQACLDSDVNFGSLNPVITDDQIFRTIIVPGRFLKNIDTSDINSVLAQFNIEYKNLVTLD